MAAGLASSADSGAGFAAGEVRSEDGRHPGIAEAIAYVAKLPNAAELAAVTGGVSADPQPKRPRKQRASARRSVPRDPKPAHLFAACAHGDADLVEALVLRCRVRVNARYKAADDWAGIAGGDRARMEPQEGTTALCYAVTWCDVLGDRVSEKLVRRLLLLRADPALDDGHPEVRFPPLAAAVANGSTRLALTLLHAGAEPDARTSDGRMPLHILPLCADPAKRSEVAEALVNAGADVNATSASGDAPVHALARDGFVDVVSTLIAFGANTLLENAEGLTAAELAQLELSFDDGARAAGLRACVQLLS